MLCPDALAGHAGFDVMPPGVTNFLLFLFFKAFLILGGHWAHLGKYKKTNVSVR